MKIYRLVVKKVHDTPHAIPSSYISRTSEIRDEFYLKKSKAEERQTQIYSGVKELAGFIDNLNVSIQEVEVIE